MITQETQRIDWHKAAQMIGVALLLAGKAAWWIAKKGGIFLVSILTVLAKVLVALVSVWASVPEPVKGNEEADQLFGYNHLGEWVEGGPYSVPPKK